MAFRPGQWVKFPGDIPGAQRAKDGKVVGIYHPAKMDLHLNARIPESVTPVADYTGENIGLRLNPEVLQLEPVLDRDDLPAGRLAHTPLNWQPKP